MRTLVTLAILLIVGFAGSRGIVSRATHRLPLAGLLATGVEFLVLGIFVGPGALNLIPADVLHSLEPVVYLALGWIGLLFGAELSVGDLRQVSGRVYRVLSIDGAVTLLAFAALMWWPSRVAWAGSSSAASVGAVAMFGVTAALTSPTIVALVAGRLPAGGPVTGVLKVFAALSALFPLLLFGLVFMVVHPDYGVYEVGGVSLAWWVVINAAAIVMGFLFVLFTQERASDDEMLLVITGTVLLAGGLSYFFHVSALYASMVMGFVVANSSRRREQIYRELHVIEKTLFVTLFVYVGAIVGIPSLRALCLVPVYVVLRMLLKYAVTGTLISRNLSDARECGARVGLGLCGHGVMAVAVALDFSLASSLESLRGPLAVVAIAALLDDGIGYTLTRRLLIRCGEARGAARAGKPADGGER